MRDPRRPQVKTVQKKPGQTLASYLAKNLKGTWPGEFRSQAVRDYACLLDVDPDVVEWSSPGPVLNHSKSSHETDFKIKYLNGTHELVIVGAPLGLDLTRLSAVASCKGYDFRHVVPESFSDDFRLQNARDLLRYASYRCPLGDRVRLMGALDDHGSMTVSECFSAFQEGKPMPGLASLILHGLVGIDLDSELIGPETQVRRIRKP